MVFFDRSIDRQHLQLLFKVRCLDDGFALVINVIAVEDGFDSALANVRKAGGEVFGRDDESGRIVTFLIGVFVILNQEFDGGDIAIIDGGFDVVEFVW